MSGLAFENILGTIEDTLKSSGMAEIAEKDFDFWQISVFYGVDGRYNMGKNRGRLPLIEYEVENENYSQNAENGGLDALSCRVRVITDHRLNKLKAQILSKKLFGKFMSDFRSTAIGRAVTTSEAVEQMESLPLGHAFSFVFEIAVSYDKNEYGYEE